MRPSASSLGCLEAVLNSYVNISCARLGSQFIVKPSFCHLGAVIGPTACARSQWFIYSVEAECIYVPTSRIKTICQVRIQHRPSRNKRVLGVRLEAPHHCLLLTRMPFPQTEFSREGPPLILDWLLFISRRRETSLS